MGSSRPSLPWVYAIPVSIETTDLVVLHSCHGVLPVSPFSGPLPTRQLLRYTCTLTRSREDAKSTACCSAVASRFSCSGLAVAALPSTGRAHRTGSGSAAAPAWGARPTRVRLVANAINSAPTRTRIPVAIVPPVIAVIRLRRSLAQRAAM